MPDLYGWILERITATERSVRDQSDAMWQVHLGADSAAQVVFRRCAADRRLLEIHKPRGVDWSTEDREWGGNPHVCEGCGQEGICQDWVTGHANDCPVLLAVAEGYGLTEEILAGLDRPAWEPPRPEGPSVLGEAAAAVWGKAMMAALLGTLTGSARLDVPMEIKPYQRPEEKALDILGPELRAIPLYQPDGDGQR